MGTLADLLIPLAGSISNERAIKMREACDALEAKIDVAQRGTNHAHDLISLLTDRVKDLESDNLDRRLTKLESAVDVLDRQRVETLKLRVNGLEDRVSKLESATKNTGEGSTSQTGAVSHSQSGGGSDGTREPARSACIDDAGTTQDTPSPASVPEWVPSETEMEALWRTHPVGGEFAAMRRLIASRAPAAPVVDVNALLTRFYSELDVCDLESKAMTRALAAQGVKCKEVQP